MFPAIRSSLSALATRAPTALASSPAFAYVHASTAVPAMEKFRYILQDHNEHNFKQGLPSNFIARLLEETDENEQGFISAKAAHRALHFLAPPEMPGQHPLTDEDASMILRTEFGVRDEETDYIPMSSFMSMFFNTCPMKKYGPMFVKM